MMHIQPRTVRPLRTALCTAAAMALVIGVAGVGQEAMAGSSNEASVSVPKKDRKAVDKAERAVEKSPTSVSARLELASAYMRVGRFEAAATTFEDARQLGDMTPGTALTLALAYVGAGQDARAVSLLDQWRDSIPAADLGLALALAGQTERGTGILGDALRAGDDTAKLRQNLAYAYALDGRWREARLMASQDVPPDQLDDRITDWAMQAQPQDYRKRVANLLGVPLRSDVGQPQHLALGGARDSGEAFAAAAPAPRAIPEPTPYYATSAGELPASDAPAYAEPETASTDFYVAEAQPVATPVEQPAMNSGSRAFDEAFAEATEAVRFVSDPVVQTAPVQVRAAVARAVEEVSASPTMVATSATMQPAAIVRADEKDCTHMVQLGSFSSADNAERAWKIFLARNPDLANFDKTITRARVRGKDFWRVSAAGFDKRTAVNMCSTVKGKGGGCIAYATDNPLPGAMPSRVQTGVRRARR